MTQCNMPMNTLMDLILVNKCNCFFSAELSFPFSVDNEKHCICMYHFVIMKDWLTAAFSCRNIQHHICSDSYTAMNHTEVCSVNVTSLSSSWYAVYYASNATMRNGKKDSTNGDACQHVDIPTHQYSVLITMLLHEFSVFITTFLQSLLQYYTTT